MSAERLQEIRNNLSSSPIIARRQLLDSLSGSGLSFNDKIKLVNKIIK